MKRKFIAGVMGLALAGCAHSRSDVAKGPNKANPNGPVGMTPVPSLDQTINHGTGGDALAQTALGDPKDPRWSGRAPSPDAGRPGTAPAPTPAAAPSPSEAQQSPQLAAAQPAPSAQPSWSSAPEPASAIQPKWSSTIDPSAAARLNASAAAGQAPAARPNPPATAGAPFARNRASRTIPARQRLRRPIN